MQGMVTFVDTDKTKPKRHPGMCYRMAGWHECGKTKGGLVALRILPLDMPVPIVPVGGQMLLTDA